MTVETQQDKELILASYQKLLASCKRSNTPERKAMIEIITLVLEEKYFLECK